MEKEAHVRSGVYFDMFSLGSMAYNTTVNLWILSNEYDCFNIAHAHKFPKCALSLPREDDDDEVPVLLSSSELLASDFVDSDDDDRFLFLCFECFAFLSFFAFLCFDFFFRLDSELSSQSRARNMLLRIESSSSSIPSLSQTRNKVAASIQDRARSRTRLGHIH